jgi:hypothetical protein
MSFVRKNISASGIVYDNAQTGLPANTLQQAIDQLAVTVVAQVVGSIWWIRANTTVVVEEHMENIVTSMQRVDGIFVVNGRNTIL